MAAVPTKSCKPRHKPGSIKVTLKRRACFVFGWRRHCKLNVQTAHGNARQDETYISSEHRHVDTSEELGMMINSRLRGCLKESLRQPVHGNVQTRPDHVLRSAREPPQRRSSHMETQRRHCNDNKHPPASDIMRPGDSTHSGECRRSETIGGSAQKSAQCVGEQADLRFGLASHSGL